VPERLVMVGFWGGWLERGLRPARKCA